MDARDQHWSINFHGGFFEGISWIYIANVRDFCTVVGGARSCSREHTTLIYPPSLNGLQNFLKIFYSVRISVACATQLRGLNGSEHGDDRPAAVYAPSCFLAKPKILTNIVLGVNSNRSWKKSCLCLLVVDLKAEQRSIVARRDVFDYWGFSRDAVTKIQTRKLLILLRWCIRAAEN